MLVQGDGHAVSGSAEGDAQIHFPTLDRLREAVGEVGIVTTHLGVGSVVDDLDAAGAQHLHQFDLVGHAGVVVADSDFHIVRFLDKLEMTKGYGSDG